MKIKGCWILICCCVLAFTCSAEEPIVAFAKQSLGLDLASVPFGQSAQTNDGYQSSSTPSPTQFNLCDDPGVTWVTDAVSAKYHQDHINRVLRYAVKNGKIVGVRVSINYSWGARNEAQFVQNRKELHELYAETVKARKLQKERPKSGSFELRWESMCGDPDPVLMELQFTPAGKFLGKAK